MIPRLLRPYVAGAVLSASAIGFILGVTGDTANAGVVVPCALLWFLFWPALLLNVAGQATRSASSDDA